MSSRALTAALDALAATGVLASTGVLAATEAVGTLDALAVAAVLAVAAAVGVSLAGTMIPMPDAWALAGELRVGLPSSTGTPAKEAHPATDTAAASSQTTRTLFRILNSTIELKCYESHIFHACWRTAIPGTS